jgi:hypothetical protein
LPPAFEREHGCTEGEWLRGLAGAVGDHALTLPAPGCARVDIDAGHLDLAWTLLPPSQIALVRMPRIHVHYRFEGVEAPARAAFMRFFDLYLHRGGG